jgi:Domain of unknown function (DUF4429)/Short C-terminal domain
MTGQTNDPHRHWDGQRWLRWDGSAWNPEAPATPPTPPPAGEQPAPAWAARQAATGPHESGTLFAKGVNGQITMTGDWMTIGRKGFGRLGHSKGDRRIPLASITAVQVRPAGSLANGFLRVTIPGSPERRGGLNDATSDENAVIFTKKHADEFAAVQTYIETYIGNRMATQNQPQQVVHPAAPDIADQIRKLASLRDDGLLTKEEFQAKKTALLA